MSTKDIGNQDIKELCITGCPVGEKGPCGFMEYGTHVCLRAIIEEQNKCEYFDLKTGKCNEPGMAHKKL